MAKKSPQTSFHVKQRLTRSDEPPTPSAQKASVSTPPPPGSVVRTSTAILGMTFALVLGLILGSLLTEFLTPREGAVSPKGAVQQAAQPASPPSAPTNPQIANLEAAVAREPANQQLWIDLANHYFDDHTPTEAIRAYERALTLGPATADVLTDLGIMYRELHRFEDALQAFRQAKALNSTHLQSRLNEGIVLYYDLGQKNAALTAWEEALALAPDTKLSSGEPLSTFIQRVKAELNKTTPRP